MTGLLEIAPATARETIDVLGHPLDVQALTIAQIARLIRRVPELREAFSGGAPSQEDAAFAALELIPPVIAAGTGHCDDEAYEAAAARLPTEEQVKIFHVVMRLTMPEPAVPFVQGSGTDPGAESMPAKNSLPPQRN